MLRVTGILKSIKLVRILGHVNVKEEPFKSNRFCYLAPNVVNFRSSSPTYFNSVENARFTAPKVTSHNQGEPSTPSQNSSQSKQALDRINLYCEHPKNTSHPFRAAEMRLKNKITISRLCVGNNQSKICSTLPNPVKTTVEAFHHKPSFLDVLNEKKLLLPLPMQSQAWPVIMSGEDFVGVGGSDEDQRLAVLLPALLHIEKRRENPGKKPTVVWTRR